MVQKLEPDTMTSIQSTSLPFSDIDRTTYEALIERFSDPKEKEPIYFPWYEVIAHIPGTLFLISHDGLPIACALCYGGQRFDARHLPAISNSHEFWFVRELNVIGNFCFIKFIIVHRDHRQKGFAKELVRIIEEHFSSHSTTIIGSVVQESNYITMRLLHQCNYQFIDHYRLPDSKELQYRVIKIQDMIQYYRSVNSENLYKASQTLIPIQLNLASRNINGLIKRMGAKLTWASFFQLSPLLTLEFGMKKVYNGHYNTLLTASPKVFSEGVKTLKDAMDYIEAKEVDGITSISSP